MKTLLALLLFVGCSYDPISGPGHKPHGPRPDPFGLTNRVSIDQFRATPPFQTLPERLVHFAADPASREIPPAPAPVRIIAPGGWEIRPVQLHHLTEVPLTLLTAPPRLKWQTVPAFYRVIVSNDGTNWFEYSYTLALKRAGWTAYPIQIAQPTNRYWKLITP
jgi:hypothetical protein